MERLKPELFVAMKSYTKEQLRRDIVAGIIVAIIALPLSIALALASGVTPERGLYTSIVGGFLISFFGGSRVTIAGPTAAFAAIVAGIVATYGMEGLVVATMMAGVFLIIMGLLGFGNLLNYIPQSIARGFTFGVAITMIIGQMKDFMGLTYTDKPIETLDKLAVGMKNLGTVNLWAIIIGVLTLGILIICPKINNKIPGSLVAIVITAGIIKIFGIEVNTIGSLYEISSELPKLKVPGFSFALMKDLLPNAITMAILASIESLLSCVVSDGMIKEKHSSNMELIGQGIGNIGVSLFGGIPATGAIARTAANVKNGGRTPVSGMVHAITILLILVIFMPLAALIPMPTIGAVLIMVAYNMSGFVDCIKSLKYSPKSDSIVFIITVVFTVAFNLVTAVGIGFVLAAILFMKRIADEADILSWNDNDGTVSRWKEIPEGTRVYEISGPLFFAVSHKLSNISVEPEVKAIILRMGNMPAMDSHVLQPLREIAEECKKENVTLILSHVHKQPREVMRKSGFDQLVGKDFFVANIDEALELASRV